MLIIQLFKAYSLGCKGGLEKVQKVRRKMFKIHMFTFDKYLHLTHVINLLYIRFHELFKT